MQRWIRRALKKCGIALPFSDVICAAYAKAIRIDPEWRAHVTVRQTLVFLDVPEPGELHDTVPLEPGTMADQLSVESADSAEIARRKRGRDRVEILWKPDVAIIPYALYEHQYSWSQTASHNEPALCIEYHCDTRTGTFLFEMMTPGAFDTAVVFERPRWPLLNTERRLVRYALAQLETGAQRAGIFDNDQRVEWKIAGPRMGARYLCVIFHRNGCVLWQDRLKKTSIVGRIRQMVGLAST